MYIYNYIYTYKYTNSMYMEMRIRIGNPNQFERRGCEPTQAHSSEYLWIKTTFCICPPFPESANSCIDLGLMENAGFPQRWWSMGKPKFWWSLYYSDFRNHKKKKKTWKTWKLFDNHFSSAFSSFEAPKPQGEAAPGPPKIVCLWYYTNYYMYPYFPDYVS